MIIPLACGGNICTVEFIFETRKPFFPLVSFLPSEGCTSRLCLWGDRLEGWKLQLAANYINLNTLQVPLMRLIVSPASLCPLRSLGRRQGSWRLSPQAEMSFTGNSNYHLAAVCLMMSLGVGVWLRILIILLFWMCPLAIAI